MILIVEDDLVQLESLKKNLPKNILVETATNIDLAKDKIENLKKKNVEYNIIFLDFQLEDRTALDLMQWKVMREIKSKVIVMSAFTTIPKVVEVIRLGAIDFLEKPVVVEKINEILKLYSKDVIDEKQNFFLNQNIDIIASPNSPLQDSLKLADVISSKEFPVFLRGESGTGKEMLAQYIHQKSQHCKGEFVALNCSAIPENLIESELFGYVKGAFTGANQDYLGQIRKANKGTLFLDEIGDMPLSVQTKLLRVLQEKKVMPVGSLKPYSVDFRIISATHKNLERLVDLGEFRQDLYYRICVFPIMIPALRDRIEDIPLLISHYLEKQNFIKDDIKKIVQTLPDSIKTYLWQGNVRELENVVYRFVAMQSLNPSWEDCLKTSGYQNKSIVKTKKRSDQEILQALDCFNQHREKTAIFLGISRRNLQYRLSKIKKNQE